MFREIMVGQELINKDQLDLVKQRLDEKLAELDDQVSSLEQMQNEKNQRFSDLKRELKAEKPGPV